jgi:hypothetical protein
VKALLPDGHEVLFRKNPESHALGEVGTRRIKKMSKLPSIRLTLLSCLSWSTIACNSELTAENITLEECQEIFGEDAAEPEKGAVEGDYNEDGTADDEDEAIFERCVELMTEEADGEES